MFFKKIKIITGLGNPGSGYENTRHNAGFLVIRKLSEKHGIALKKKAFGGIYGYGKILGKDVTLFEPQTYMNLSGEAVKAICSRQLKDREDLLVISDDVALPLGMTRIRARGSSGGHNGLGSIIQYMGEDFARLRVGVGREMPVENMKSYVLSNFSPEEQKALSEGITRAVLCVEEWLVSGVGKAMSGYNEGKSGR